MRIFKNRHVMRLARRFGVSDSLLRTTMERAEAGLVDANLGKFLIKQRLSRPQGGRSGGLRTIVFYRSGDLAVLLYMFAKNERENLTVQELNIYRDVARTIGHLSPQEIEETVAAGKWIEI